MIAAAVKSLRKFGEIKRVRRNAKLMYTAKASVHKSTDNTHLLRLDNASHKRSILALKPLPSLMIIRT
jgi:hypothetical protein